MDASQRIAGWIQRKGFEGMSKSSITAHIREEYAKDEWKPVSNDELNPTTDAHFVPLSPRYRIIPLRAKDGPDLKTVMAFDAGQDSLHAKLKAKVEEALDIDGAHHKQWYLEQIAEILEIPHESEGIAP